MSAWPPEDLEPSAYSGTATGTTGTAGVYRNRFGALQPYGRDGAPEISQQFTFSNMHLVIQPATDPTLDKQVGTITKRLKRAGYSCQKPYSTQFAGFPDARAMVVAKKKKGRRPAGAPQVQLYAQAGPCSIALTVAQSQDSLVQSVGPVTINPAAPPAIVPIVRVGVPNVSGVAERLVLTERRARLTAFLTRDPVTDSTDQFVSSCLQGITSRLKDGVVNEGQPDMFLGGQYCIRHTFVIGGVKTSSNVRSEYWWAGVVNGYGVQIFVVGTKSIIDLDHARGLKDAVVLIPPD